MKIKLIHIILLLVLSLTSVAQEKKTVAVLDPMCRDNTVNVFFKQMVRGAIESAVTNSEEYEAYDRSAFDLIQKEHAFQQSGVVNDSQIKKMGEMAGVDYVLVSEVSSYDGYISVVVKILNITTGKYDKSVDDYMLLSPEAVKSKCNDMATMLFGNMQMASSSEAKEMEEDVYYFTDEVAEFPGGAEALSAFLSKNIHYPESASEKGITGTVLVEFVVEKDGSIGNVKVRIPLYPDCDMEAVLGVMAMPKWKPARNMGIPVRSFYQIPITFRQ